MTGMARKVVSLVPSALKAGIIMGAGLSAVVTVFKEGGRFDAFPPFPLPSASPFTWCFPSISRS